LSPRVLCFDTGSPPSLPFRFRNFFFFMSLQSLKIDGLFLLSSFLPPFLTSPLTKHFSLPSVSPLPPKQLLGLVKVFSLSAALWTFYPGRCGVLGLGCLFADACQLREGFFAFPGLLFSFFFLAQVRVARPFSVPLIFSPLFGFRIFFFSPLPFFFLGFRGNIPLPYT